VRHPAIVQIRGDEGEMEEVKGMIENCRGEYEFERVKGGLDVYFSDVNDARFVLSKLSRVFDAEIKMSTKYAGLRRGRVRVLFVYSFRIRGRRGAGKGR